MMTAPRVLILHNRYRLPGGEDRVVAAQAQLLRAHGHEVRVFEKDNREIDGCGLLRKGVLFFKTASNASAAAEVAALAAEFQPQAALIHNTLPLLSPSIYAPLKKAGVKAVQYLHNYRLLCPAGTFFRGGQPCRLCVDDGLKHAVSNRCWNNSRLASLAVTRMIERHRRAETWLRQVDTFVAVNSWMRDQLVAAGVVPAERVRVHPNFTEMRPASAGAGAGFVYLGRLTPEKGVGTLLRAWSGLAGVPLKILGEPASAAQGEAWRRQAPGVVFAGFVPDAAAQKELAAARALIFPSEWQEPFGLSIIEAMALGRPVIASRVAGPMEIVQDGVTGLLFEPGDSAALAQCVRCLQDDPELALKMGQAGRERCLKEYSPEAAYRRMAELWV